MKKLGLEHIFLGYFLLETNPVLTADIVDLDVTMQVMGAGDHNSETIMNQIKLPEGAQAKTRTRTQTRVMDGEQNGDMNQLRTQTRTEEMNQIRDTSRDASRDASREASRDQMQEQKQQIIMENSGPLSPGGGR